MTASKSRKARSSSDPQLTAQPSSISQQIRRLSTHEKGLSVDPEDLGKQYLLDATEQSNYESLNGDEPLTILGGANSDGAMVGASFDSNSSVWEQTVGLSQSETDEDLRAPALETEDESEPREGDAGGHRRPRAVDTRHSSIEEASLMDQDSEEQEDLEAPEVNTDDQR